MRLFFSVLVGHRGSFILEATVNCALHTSLGEDTSVRSICKSGVLGPRVNSCCPTVSEWLKSFHTPAPANEGSSSLTSTCPPLDTVESFRVLTILDFKIFTFLRIIEVADIYPLPIVLLN